MSTRAPTPPASSADERQQGDLVEVSSSPNTEDGSPNQIQKSDETLQNGDSERHPKGRRKRTTPEDKKILETAYKANPKPDKVARLDIVKRVSLNEKEVQIWFQNRRQNDRRKQRPLSSHELLSLRYGGMRFVPSEACAYDVPPYEDRRSSTSTAPAPVPTSSMTDPDASARMASEIDRASAEERDEAPSRGYTTRPSPTSTPVSDTRPSQPRESTPAHLAWTCFTSGGNPVVARRSGDSLSSLHPISGYHLSTNDTIRPDVAAPRPLKLSSSLDGKAELVNRSPAPSPSSSSDSVLPSLRRSSFEQDDSPPEVPRLPPLSTLLKSLDVDQQPPHPRRSQPHYVPSLSRGRSRDTQAWEYAADGENVQLNDELTAQAEREALGSATVAISLLRSTSSASLHSRSGSHNNLSAILQPNNAKRNARTNPLHHLAKRPKLSRTLSSVARLQTDSLTDMLHVRGEEHDETDFWKKPHNLSTLLSPGGGESDKENMSPDEDGNPTYRHRPVDWTMRRRQAADGFPRPNSRRTFTRSHTGGYFRGSREVPSLFGQNPRIHDSMPMTGRRKTAPTVDIFEDDKEYSHRDSADSADHGSASRPRTAGNEPAYWDFENVSPSKKGDVDCAQGLLALSQGRHSWK